MELFIIIRLYSLFPTVIFSASESAWKFNCGSPNLIIC